MYRVKIALLLVCFISALLTHILFTDRLGRHLIFFNFLVRSRSKPVPYEGCKKKKLLINLLTILS
jgi:hypothetical protein